MCSEAGPCFSAHENAIPNSELPLDVQSISQLRDLLLFTPPASVNIETLDWLTARVTLSICTCATPHVYDETQKVKHVNVQGHNWAGIVTMDSATSPLLLRWQDDDVLDNTMLMAIFMGGETISEQTEFCGVFAIKREGSLALECTVQKWCAKSGSLVDTELVYSNQRTLPLETQLTWERFERSIVSVLM